MIHTGDCIEVMAGMPADSVDAICTDPPYGLEFMGKGWDKFGAVVEHPDDGEGPWGRTARVRFAAGQSFQAWCEAWGREALRVTKPGGYLLAFGGTRTHHRLVCGLEDAGWIIRDELDWIYASGFPKGKANLKPAHEPIVLARKPGPLRPLNIEETRIGPPGDKIEGGTKGTTAIHGGGITLRAPVDQSTGRWPSNLLLSDPELFDEPNPYVVGSGAVSVSGTLLAGTPRNPDNDRHAYGEFYGARTEVDFIANSGGYSRFFIVPKADRSDREPAVTPDGHDRSKRFSTHPTVKPTDLMRHLVRLVTPSGGLVLDPFLGSGSTAIACELEGFPWIGIEKEPEYVAIAEARLNGVQRGLGLDVGAPTRKRGLPSEEKLAELGKTYEGHATYSGGWGWETPDEEPAA